MVARAAAVAHDHELPRLAVLGARCMGRRVEDLRDLGVGNGSVGERAARALAGDDREQVVGHADDAPTRANEFTYMIRRLGPNAQWRNSAVSVAPIRSITSGVIALNARSGSSVSIS